MLTMFFSKSLSFSVETRISAIRRSKICAPRLKAPVRKSSCTMAWVATTGRFHRRASVASFGEAMM
ncbi:hypothetical protein D3C84_1307200 [compost metagenome]